MVGDHMGILGAVVFVLEHGSQVPYIALFLSSNNHNTGALELDELHVIPHSSVFNDLPSSRWHTHEIDVVLDHSDHQVQPHSRYTYEKHHYLAKTLP
jgi:hypothetical protein